MYILSIIVSALVLAASSTAIPHAHEDTETSPVLRSPLEKRDTYDCKGSSFCGSATLSVADCDNAVNNKIIRNNDVNYGASGSGRPYSGACSGYCGVFIQGPSGCARTGNQIWYDYQDIRHNGCAKCGSKHWGASCLTTINYVANCNS